MKNDYPFLFTFQRMILDWSLKLGKSAIFADCGMGKTPMQLCWADEVAKHTGRRILILTPLAVADQTVREGEKFGIEVMKSAGNLSGQIIATNYEKLHKFDASDFSGVVCDESSILKNYSGSTRKAITEFMKTIPYRLLCTATPAPNDYTELGTSSEALGVMRSVEMMSTYFVHDSGSGEKWRLKGHADEPFWAFMASWSRAIRKPSDLGFDDGLFVLPELIEIQHVVASAPRPGELFVSDAMTLNEQRAERKTTLADRCAKVAELANSHSRPFVAWCSLNDESRELTRLIQGAVELSGADSDEAKVEKMTGFSKGDIRALVTKPSIAGFGMNWQHCSDTSFFPSHSYEQYYQAIRRFWRFGQTNKVNVNIVTSQAESAVLENMQRKERESRAMYEMIVRKMGKYYQKANSGYNPTIKMEVPKWM